MQRLTLALIAAILMALSHPGLSQTLKGSRASMERQNQIAIKHGYTFIKTSKVVTGLVDAGDLVKVSNSKDFELHDVSYPYARPAVKAFIERLGSQYRAACGEKLTVTSLTRPIDRQPANASTDSVHPTGMAVDLRIPPKQKCRTWLESYLLDMESDDVLDVTRERRPPHYHVAVFPDTYEQYVVGLSASTREYTVRRGDTLTRIAASTGTSVAQLRATNGLRNDLIQIGQKLLVRTSDDASETITTIAASTSGSSHVAATEVTTHRVKRGETLWRIARQYGTTTDALAAKNNLASDILQVGQTLTVK
jgi:LysM repeat protein